MIEELYKLIGTMSKRKFAQKYGIPIRTLEDWLAGRRTPTDYVVALLSKVVEYEKMLVK